MKPIRKVQIQAQSNQKFNLVKVLVELIGLYNTVLDPDGPLKIRCIRNVNDILMIGANSRHYDEEKVEEILQGATRDRYSLQNMTKSIHMLGKKDLKSNILIATIL